MKKFLFIFCLLFIPLAFGMTVKSPSPLFETYIGSTKDDIVTDLNDKPQQYLVSDKIYVRIDSLNRWMVNDNYYTYFFDFEDGSRLTTSFSLSNNRCTNYMFDFNDYKDYGDMVMIFDDSFQKIDSTTWFDSSNRSVLKIFKKGYRNGFSLYVYKKITIDPYKLIFKEYKK